jgi:hypothetical protein
MSRNIRCAHCRCLFLPDPRVKTQRFCSNKTCQRARKTRWQRDKLASDPDYRANQRDAQRSWNERHPHYWRQYRQRRADDAERKRILQPHRDHQPRVPEAAKMDPSPPISVLKPGMYHLIPEVAAQDLAKMDVLSHKCRLIPIT